MSSFVPGQRWISETEPELGLGTVVETGGNRVTVLFVASSERRTYAVDNAPLTRVRFSAGDRIEAVDGWFLTVSGVEENAGLLTYLGIDEDGDAQNLEETALNPHLQFNKPQDRLFTGQIDADSLFRLRYLTLLKQQQLDHSAITGLVGARTSLIPHQLYIAHEVASRQAPRVLLADEVGLGKTIEAGLILHRLLLTGRAERVLILVPEPLLHQWLVEMRRRFNLKFSLFDDDRWWHEADGNPFLGEQLVLCSLPFFRDEAERQEKALAAGWDLCIVDEAHHLEWSPEAPSADYRFVEQLARVVPSFLLLTATPEQLGKQSHFARLRLLDPDRFFDFDAFQEEESHYREWAGLIEPLIEEGPLSEAQKEKLTAVLADDRAENWLAGLDDPEMADEARRELAGLMLDRHGTGRVLFRNTRQTVAGFPERELNAHTLAKPPEYTANVDAPLDAHLYPERAYTPGENLQRPWWRFDPRVRWLIDKLREIRPAKVLVICAKAQTALELEEALRVLAGIGAAVFHEGLGIVSRDRAAAWFADEEEGAQVLVCSEIGSEGRNFQFAHHLVLFDLPINPDLLEQRIGRLDRIGQRETIRIHVPHLEGCQAGLFAWYHEGLDAFRQPCPTGAAVLVALQPELHAALQAEDAALFTALIERTRQMDQSLRLELQRGRDRLLELNSCRREQADAIAEQIGAAADEDELWPYLDQVFDVYGVTVEEHSEHCHILLPGDHMLVPNFPEIPEDGVTVTLDRDIGLAREDMAFLTWEHPLVRGAMDLIVNNTQGNTAFSVVRHPELGGGQLLLEAVYRIECPAPRRLNAGFYFPQSLLRFVVDSQPESLGDLPVDSFTVVPRPVEREEVAALMRGQRPVIERMLKLSDRLAQKRVQAIIDAALKHMLDVATAELKRLAALRKVNPSVRKDELDLRKAEALELHRYIQSAHLRLDAIRVMLTA